MIDSQYLDLLGLQISQRLFSLLKNLIERLIE